MSEDKLQTILKNIRELSFNELLIVSEWLSKTLYAKGVEDIIRNQNKPFEELIK